MANQFLGNDHLISSEEAKKMIEKFKRERDNILRSEYAGKYLVPDYESFDRVAFDDLLKREDCKGVRIYYGMKEEDLRIHAIIVGVDAEGKDILSKDSETNSADSSKDSDTNSSDPPIIENGLTCPPYCG